MLVLSAKGLQLRAAGDNIGKLEAAGCVVTKRLGERIEYDIGSSKSLRIDSEVNLHLQIKDIFGGAGDMEEAINSRLQQMYYDQDMHLILEIIGWDETNKVEYVLGERYMQLLDII